MDMRERIQQRIEEYREKMIADIMEIVEIPSVSIAKVGELKYNESCRRAMSWYLEKATEMGFQTKMIDGKVGYVDLPAHKDDAPLWIIAVHLDVVPPGAGWKEVAEEIREAIGDIRAKEIADAFHPVKIDNKIYGRGTTDDKGPAVGALYTLKIIRDLAIARNVHLRIIFGADEETALMRDMKCYIDSMGLPDCGISPDSGDYAHYGEKNRLIYKHVFGFAKDDPNVNTALSTLGFALESLKGGTADNMVPDRAEAVIHCLRTRPIADEVIRYNLGNVKDLPPEDLDDDSIRYTIRLEPVSNYKVRIVAEGKAAHAQDPSQGMNAIQRLCILLSDLFGNLTPQPIRFIRDMYMLEGDGASLGLKYSDDDGVLTACLSKMEYALKGGYARVNLRFPQGKSFDSVKAQITRMSEQYGIETEFEYEAEGFKFDTEKPFYKALESAYETVMHEPLKKDIASIGTYARAFGGKVLCFGTVLEGEQFPRYHQPGEFINIDNFLKHLEIQIIGLKMAAETCKAAEQSN